MVKAGELPQRRTYLRAYLAEVRRSLIADLGPTEADLTMAQRVLINAVVSKLSVIRCIEEQVKEDGVFRGRELRSVLSKSYITYTNSLRLDLQALGINTRKGAEIVDLGTYIARYQEPEAEGPAPASDTTPNAEPEAGSAAPGPDGQVEDELTGDVPPGPREAENG